MMGQITRYSSLSSHIGVSGLFIHPVIIALIHTKSSTLIYKYRSIEGLGGALPRFSFRGDKLGDGSLVSLIFNVALPLSPPLLLAPTLGILGREWTFNGATLFLVETVASLSQHRTRLTNSRVRSFGHRRRTKVWGGFYILRFVWFVCFEFGKRPGPRLVGACVPKCRTDSRTWSGRGQEDSLRFQTEVNTEWE